MWNPSLLDDENHWSARGASDWKISRDESVAGPRERTAATCATRPTGDA
jgi:hypothetical protein